MLAAIKMPKLSEIDEYKIIRFHHKAGDTVKKGDLFLTAMLDDGTERGVGFYLSGTISEINVSEGSYVREDSLLGVMEDGK
jgi:pyruvate/2-oxoglutarate dehydrogenase complex dihydrolipoamide acyltransferase (E2) component